MCLCSISSGGCSQRSVKFRKTQSLHWTMCTLIYMLYLNFFLMHCWIGQFQFLLFEFVSVQFSRSIVSDSATPWITARQAALSITNSRSSLRLMSSLRFYGDGISCLWPVILAQGPFWWCTCCSAKTDASKEISGRLVGHVVSPFNLSWILPVGVALLVPCSLPGSPVIK